MTLRPWHWLLAVVALVIPLQAVAGGSGGGGLATSASLGYCGVSETGISCRIDVSWTGVSDAERYSATATLADGSVMDLGTVGAGSGGGSTSVWVPYVGDGTYSVLITAWGEDEGEEKKLDDGTAKIQAPKDMKPEVKPPDEDGEKPPGESQPEEPQPEEPEPTPEEPAPEPEPEPPAPVEPEPVEPAPVEPAPVPEEPAPPVEIPEDTAAEGVL
jgi:hypothetical protein